MYACPQPLSTVTVNYIRCTTHVWYTYSKGQAPFRWHHRRPSCDLDLDHLTPGDLAECMVFPQTQIVFLLMIALPTAHLRTQYKQRYSMSRESEKHIYYLQSAALPLSNVYTRSVNGQLRVCLYTSARWKLYRERIEILKAYTSHKCSCQLMSNCGYFSINKPSAAFFLFSSTFSRERGNIKSDIIPHHAIDSWFVSSVLEWVVANQSRARCCFVKCFTCTNGLIVYSCRLFPHKYRIWHGLQYKY